MFKKLLILSIIFCSSLIEASTFSVATYVSPIDKMPIMEKLDINKRGATVSPQRDEKYIKYLAASVRINTDGGSGSGTIIYYDKSKNLAYIASCGHLWDGSMTAEEAAKRNVKCKIFVWYKNNVKLKEPEFFEAKVLFCFHSNKVDDGKDTSLLSFTPDWKPNYFPIAPENYNYPKDVYVNSCGCDHGLEVAHYDVKIFDAVTNASIVTNFNSPRPGRSGGGLMDNDKYIGTCWGTQFVDGSGQGYFTSLSSIHKIWKQNGYGFLLNITSNSLATEIPIKNKNSKDKTYDQKYILLPEV